MSTSRLKKTCTSGYTLIHGHKNSSSPEQARDEPGRIIPVDREKSNRANFLIEMILVKKCLAPM